MDYFEYPRWRMAGSLFSNNLKTKHVIKNLTTYIAVTSNARIDKPN